MSSNIVDFINSPLKMSTPIKISLPRYATATCRVWAAVHSYNKPKVAWPELRRVLIAQQNNLEDSATQLHQILGRYVDHESLDEPVLPVRSRMNLEELIDVALSDHPAMRVASSNIDAAQSEHLRSLRSRYPNVDLRLATEYGDDIGGLSMAIPKKPALFLTSPTTSTMAGVTARGNSRRSAGFTSKKNLRPECGARSSIPCACPGLQTIYWYANSYFSRSRHQVRANGRILPGRVFYRAT